MKAAIYNLLNSDSTLMSALTGGLYHEVSEISRQATPDAYDGNKELQPCALIRQETGTPWGPHDHSARLYVTIWFYERNGYTNIEAARKRVYDLLHRQKLTPVDGSGNYDIRHADDLLDQEEPELGVSMAMSRYVATMERS